MADPNLDGGFLAWLWSEPGKAALAGAAGGVVRWVTLRDSWREGVPGIIVGAVCAIYLGPLVAPLLEPVVGAIAPGSEADYFAAFIVGLGGIGLTAGLIDLLQSWRKSENNPKRRDHDSGGDDAQS